MLPAFPFLILRSVCPNVFGFLIFVLLIALSRFVKFFYV